MIEDNTGRFSTISGFLIDQLKSMPRTGDVVETSAYSFEIIDMDGVRIDKVLMSLKSDSSKSFHE